MNNEFTKTGAVSKSIYLANQSRANVTASGENLKLYFSNDTGELIVLDNDGTERAFYPYTNYTITAVDLTLTSAHFTVEVTATGKTITLPSAVGIAGRPYEIDNSSAGNITVDSNGGTIQGETSQSVPPDSNLLVKSNGTNWRIK